MTYALRAAGFLLTLFLVWLLAVWPPPVWFRSHWPAETAFMAIRGAGRSYIAVPLDSIAPSMVEAAIIGEDNNFYAHHGIDYLALAQALGYPRRTFSWADPRDRQALLAVLPRAWSRRDRLRGASTITQQLAKNLYLSPSRNPLRKLKEAVTAWRIEAALSKRRILELYLNVAELGDGLWGVEAASRRYFGRSARQLTAEQAAALAGALPFPRRSNPALRPGRMRWRQQLILRRMRGEWVEVPPVADEDATPPADSVLAGDSAGTPPDSIAGTPGDSILLQDPRPGDSVPAPSEGVGGERAVPAGEQADSG
ncbi:MAG TPA: biosynthetic peptidoglycan transglycosylase [Gemmatimonadales bacterium]|jgi:monofunctional biosynthetic peptidoglycan transglycosylase|nr:biosynthetic peptidoglycan transglycosylase [Gemmatimonadales bacterium]